MKATNCVSYCAIGVAVLIALQGGNPPPATSAHEPPGGEERLLEGIRQRRIGIVGAEGTGTFGNPLRPGSFYNDPSTFFAQAPVIPAPTNPIPPPAPAPTPEPLSIKISGPKHPILGDRPVWYAEVHGDAGIPSWRVSPPSTGLVVKANGLIVEWEPPYSGEFTIYVSVGGVNKTAADDAYHVKVVQLVQDNPTPAPIQPLPPVPAPPPPADMGDSHTVSQPRDKQFWNRKVSDLVSNVPGANKVAEARSISGLFMSLIARVERDNFGGTEYTDDLRRATIALMGPQRAAPWDTFFAGLGRDLTLQDLRYIENALAHIVQAASRGSSGGKIETAKET